MVRHPPPPDAAPLSPWLSPWALGATGSVQSYESLSTLRYASRARGLLSRTEPAAGAPPPPPPDLQLPLATVEGRVLDPAIGEDRYDTDPGLSRRVEVIETKEYGRLAARLPRSESGARARACRHRGVRRGAL